MFPMAKKSPLAPAAFPSLPPVAGVRVGAAACGLRYQGRDDLFMAEMDPGTTIAGVFTTSLTASAPVEWCRRASRGGRARAIIVNAGNANAFTGRAGRQEVDRTVEAASLLVGCPKRQVFVASTGVIGEVMPANMIGEALPALRKHLGDAEWDRAAAAIMTTDTFAKGATRTAIIDGATVTINGITKGSGMIAPDMATMLAFVFTDAAIPAPVLTTLLNRAAARSFNAITVDGDTSTSDTVLLCATANAGHDRVAKASQSSLRDFRAKLDDLMVDLAQQIVRDGEGAEKFVTIQVNGAASARAARRIAFSVANSPLVKTAIAGADANWGRIVMAVGKAGEKADRDRLTISIGGVPVTANGMACPDYDETPVTAHMKGRNIDIAIDLGLGRGSATVWTCDLTHGYININGSYRS